MDEPKAPAAEPALQGVPGEDLADRRRLYRACAYCMVAGTALWLAGWLALRGTGTPTRNWDAVWALAAVSFLSSVLIPIPGVTAALLLALSHNPVLGTFAVLGAATGSTLGAALLLALGKAGREHLRKRATRSARARRTLEWSRRLETRWTYAGVVLLLVPQFIPKLVVLYAAVLVQLRTAPFLVAVFVGVFLRNVVVLAFFVLGTNLLGF